MLPIKSLKILVSFLVLGYLLLAACYSSPPPQTSISFYHWKSEFKPNNSELTYLDQLKVQRLYLRFFDIDWNFTQQEAVPLAILHSSTSLPDSIALVPTLFITNRTFLHLPENQLPDLVHKTHKKIMDHLQDFPNHPIAEIQIDCDWTAKTQSIYFDFLKKLNAKFAKLPISTTIRLHQIKYFKKTGVPPVDRGTLMFYNMGEVDQWATQNSILDLDLARQYLVNFENYPLSLDLALPLFSWAVLFREGRMIRLINGIHHSHMEDNQRFNKVGKNRFEVIKSTYLQGQYLYRGDAIRIESIQLSDLQEAVQMLGDKWPQTDRHLIFYHLDSSIINRYPYESIQQVSSLFSN